MSDTIVFSGIVLAAVALGALIALAGVRLARRDHSGLGEEGVNDILGYGPSHWPMGRTNGHREPDEHEEVG